VTEGACSTNPEPSFGACNEHCKCSFCAIVKFRYICRVRGTLLKNISNMHALRCSFILTEKMNLMKNGNQRVLVYDVRRVARFEEADFVTSL
jgi:hypothetical protein